MMMAKNTALATCPFDSVREESPVTMMGSFEKETNFLLRDSLSHVVIVQFQI